jgi:hypothetical protein
MPVPAAKGEEGYENERLVSDRNKEVYWQK